LTALAYFIFQNHWLIRSESFKPALKLSWSPLLLFVLLTFFNGITPYAGLKTSTNFSMFSNLKVEGENTNHLFMPALTRLSDIQTNTVTLLETDDPYLQNYIKRNERITYFELTRYLYNNLHKDIHVSYRKDNREKTIQIPEQPPEKWLTSSYLERKLLNFRGVPASGPTPCQW